MPVRRAPHEHGAARDESPRLPFTTSNDVRVSAVMLRRERGCIVPVGDTQQLWMETRDRGRPVVLLADTGFDPRVWADGRRSHGFRRGAHHVDPPGWRRSDASADAGSLAAAHVDRRLLQDAERRVVAGDDPSRSFSRGKVLVSQPGELHIE
ncbi:MAG: hypothetical protein QOD24_1393 [Solirubrobacteraceae bacterium]|nr:hypothetical protein [Solirubrobacteraceae bacterium]